MNHLHLNVKNIGYSRPIHTKKGYNMLVNYAGTKPITIVSPIVECPYGVDHNDGNCTMKLRINDGPFLQLLNDIDDKNADLPDTFNLFSASSETEKEPFYYTPFLEDQDALRVRIPLKNGKRYDVEVHSKNEAIDYNLATVGDIVPGAKLKCTLEWKHVWIVGRTFGYFWTVREIEIM